jgi:hypothetical protein
MVSSPRNPPLLGCCALWAGGPHPICSCRRPPISALPPPLPGGGFGEENSVQLGLVAEKFPLSANNIEKLESFPELIQLRLQRALGNQILGISFRYPDLLHIIGLEARQPWSVIYQLLSHQPACPLRALPDMLFCKYFSRSSLSSSTDYTPMEAVPSVPRNNSATCAPHRFVLSSLGRYT